MGRTWYVTASSFKPNGKKITRTEKISPSNSIFRKSKTAKSIRNKYNRFWGGSVKVLKVSKTKSAANKYRRLISRVGTVKYSKKRNIRRRIATRQPNPFGSAMNMGNNIFFR